MSCLYHRNIVKLSWDTHTQRKEAQRLDLQKDSEHRRPSIPNTGFNSRKESKKNQIYHWTAKTSTNFGPVLRLKSLTSPLVYFRTYRWLSLQLRTKSLNRTVQSGIWIPDGQLCGTHSENGHEEVLDLPMFGAKATPNENAVMNMNEIL